MSTENIKQMLMNPQRRRRVAEALAAMMGDGQGAPQAPQAPQGGPQAGPPSTAPLVNPQQNALLPQGMTQIPQAPNTNIGSLINPGTLGGTRNG